jgi:flagellar biosynthesis protein FlhA
MTKRTHPVVVEEMTPALLSLGQVQRALQALLDEGVPIRDLVRIFEALSLRAKVSTDADGLVEAARAALGPAIANRYADNGSLPVITLDPQLEHSMLEALRPTENGAVLALDGGLMEAVANNVAQLANAAEQRGVVPVLACSPALRPPLYRLLRSAGQPVPVLSYPEISGFPARIETMGVVTGAYAHSA